MTTSVVKARLAVIGAGTVGKRHIGAIADSETADLVAVCDSDPDARFLADKHSAAFHKDTKELLESEALDGVIVAVPTEHHLPVVLSVLEHGVHVLVEKPITATMSEAEAVIEASNRSGRHVLVGHHRRYFDCVETARDIIQNGTLGNLIAISGQWNVRKPDDYYRPDWRLKREAGPVLTNLIHDMDTLRYICGEIESVSAEISCIDMGVEKEDSAALIVRLVNGAVGTFVLSDRTNSPWSWEFGTGENPALPRSGANSLRFMGTSGALEFPNLVLWSNDPDRQSWAHPIESTEIPTSLEEPFVAQIDHFSEVVLGQAEPRITASDAAMTLRATLAVFEAAEAGQRVVL